MFAAAFLPLTTLAYTPTEMDQQWLESIEDKIDWLFPTHASRLVQAYDLLGTKKMHMKLAWWDRGIYLLEEMQDIMMKKLFTQSAVCLDMHAQMWDTAEMNYKVYNDDGFLVRESKYPFAFTIWAPHVWRSLSISALWLQEWMSQVRTIPSLWVTAEDQDVEEKMFSPGQVAASADSLVLWQEFIFGSPKADGAIIGVFTWLRWDQLAFDFTDASTGRTVSVYTRIESLIKWCM